MNRISLTVRLSALTLGCVAIMSAAPAVRLPFSFEPNHGQHDRSVLFSSRTPSGRVALTSTGAVFIGNGGAELRMRFEGANRDVRLSPEEPLVGRVNYFLGQDAASWQTDIPTFARVRYEGIYPGIDLVFYSSATGRLEYDFIVSPGADPSRIRLKLASSGEIRIAEDDELVANSGASELRQQAPVLYQGSGGGRRAIAGRYRLEADTLTFDVGAYDATRALVIDPVVVFSSYLGGSSGDEARGIAVDKDGNVYITGGTSSSNFPTRNPLQANRTDTQADAYVAKLTPDGTALIFSTYIGGTSGDQGRSIAVGVDGSVYVGGLAGSSFPVTAGAFQTQRGLQTESFLLKLNPSGSQLMYATYIGGSRGDTVTAVAVDDTGNLYATGSTTSDNFPVTPGAAIATRPATGANNDAFILKLNPAGTAMVYSTLVGGSDQDEGRAIALRNGSAYITGATESTNVPVTAGVAQPALKGTQDAFVAAVNTAGSAFTLLTYLGGTNVDEGLGIALDVFGDIYVTGKTLATDFPTTPGVLQTQRKGTSNDGFVTKLAANGSALIYSTYLGSGGGVDHLNSIAVDRNGAAYIVGQSADDYPVTANALQPQDGGGSDLVFSKVASDGRRLLYSSFLGGAGAERTGMDSGDGGGNTIAELNCMAYITGRTLSTNFPTTAGSFQTISGGAEDAVFAKIDPSGDLGEPQIGCSAMFLAPLRPLIGQLTPRSIGTLFGINFSASTASSPQVGPNGLIAVNLANTCVEIDGRRAPVYFVNATQLNFQVPVETALGWVRVFVIRNCDQTNAVRSEPLFVEVRPVLPEFFVFGLADPAIAAVNDTATSATGNTVIVGPASAGAPYTPAAPGDIVSAYFTAGGGTSPALATGQIPGGVFNLTGTVTVQFGAATLAAADVFYAGASPCCAGLDQLTFRVPNVPAGNHPLTLTINGVASPSGPFISVR